MSFKNGFYVDEKHRLTMSFDVSMKLPNEYPSGGPKYAQIFEFSV